MEILNEVYFGRKPIEPLQKQLTKFRDKLANKPVTSSTNVDPELLKFNRLCESIFGFNSFSIYIQLDNLPNAYAIPVDTFFSDEERKQVINSIILSASTGGYFKFSSAFENVSLIIAINSGLLNNPEFTDEELMATILHEIGHGFFEAVMDKDGTYTLTKKITNLLIGVLSLAKDKIKHGKYVTEKIINKELYNLNGFITDIKSKLLSIKYKLFLKESNEDNMRKNRIDYTNEKFADTFAAMFGYAEECHSVDIKIMKAITKDANGVKTYSKLAEVFKTYKLYVKDFIRYIFNTQDEHPAELARIKTTADYIKKELSKESLDPKIKKELLIELEKINKLIDDYIHFPKDEDSMRILRLYHIKLYEKFGGDRREQDTDNNALFDTIDDRYNSLGGSSNATDN